MRCAFMVKIIYLFFSLLFLYSCHSSKLSIGKPSQLENDFSKNWRLNPAPNNFDSVGVIFSIDKNGQMTTLGSLELNTHSDTIRIPKELDSLNTSFSLMADFLLLKNKDSIKNAEISHSTNIVTNFKINQGIETVYDLNTNLRKAFNSKREIILDNQFTLDLMKKEICLVVKTIRSGNVDLSFQKTSNSSGDFTTKIIQLLSVKPNAKILVNKSTSITYSNSEPLIIFYQLRHINPNIINSQGNEPQKVVWELGDYVTNSSLF